MPQRLDRLLVLAAAALVGAIAWTSLDRGGRPAAPPAAEAAPLRPAPVPARVVLHPSSTAFLRTCPAADLRLSEAAGTLTLRFAGARCHLPPLRLRALERDASGRVVYAGPALRYELLSGNYAVRGERRAKLLGPCREREGSLTVTVAGAGLTAAGRC